MLRHSPIHRISEKRSSWQLRRFEGHKRWAKLSLVIDFLAGQSNLHQLFAFLYSLLFGQIEVA